MSFLTNLDSLFVLTPIAFLLAAFFKDRITDRQAYRRGLGIYVAAAIFGHVLPGIYVIGVYLGVVGMPVGWILELISLQLLCLSLCGGRRKAEEKNSPN